MCCQGDWRTCTTAWWSSMGLIASLRFEKDADVNEASNFFDITVDNNKIINIRKRQVAIFVWIEHFLDLNIGIRKSTKVWIVKNPNVLSLLSIELSIVIWIVQNKNILSPLSRGTVACCQKDRNPILGTYYVSTPSLAGKEVSCYFTNVQNSDWFQFFPLGKNIWGWIYVPSEFCNCEEKSQK